MNGTEQKSVVCYCTSCGSRLVVPELPAKCSHCGAELEPMTKDMNPIYWKDPDYPFIDSRDITVREIFDNLDREIGRLIQSGIIDVTKDECEAILKKMFQGIWDIRFAKNSSPLFSPVYLRNKKQDILLSVNLRNWPLFGEPVLHRNEGYNSIVLGSVKYRKGKDGIRHIEIEPDEELKGKTLAQAVDMTLETTRAHVQRYFDSQEFIESVCRRADLTEEEREKLSGSYWFMLNCVYPTKEPVSQQELQKFLTLPARSEQEGT